MKKVLCLFLCLFLLVPSAQAENGDDSAQWLYEKSLERAVLVGKLAHSDAYIESMLSVTDEFSDLLDEIRTEDFSQPIAMRVYHLHDSVMSLTAMMALGISTDPDVREVAAKRTSSSAASVILGQYGAKTLAICSVLSVTSACPQPESMDHSMLVMLDYAGGWSVAITYTVYPDQVMMVYAVLLPFTDDPLPFLLAGTPTVYRDDALAALMP